MPTVRYTLTAGSWTDVGQTPCLVQLVQGDPAVYVIEVEPPADNAPDGHIMPPDPWSLLGVPIQGGRLYLRPQATVLKAPTVVAVSQGPLGAGWASPPVDWQPVAVNVIAQTGVYQELFPEGTALRGGTIVNTSAPGSDPLWVDPTGETGSVRSTAAMPVYPAFDSASAPGAWRVPPTRGAVTIMGPAGATFQAFSG